MSRCIKELKMYYMFDERITQVSCEEQHTKCHVESLFRDQEDKI